MIRWLEKRWQISWTMVVVIAVLIFYFSSLTGGQIGGPSSLKPIVYHITIFFIFSFFLFIAVIAGKNRKFIPFVISLAALYGILDELHQYFVPGRSAAVSDFLLDGMGIVFAFLLYGIILEYRK